MKLTYGILSTATIAKRFIDAVRKHGDEVGAIASRNLQKAQDYALKEKIQKAYGSYQELLNDSSIDIIYIPTNNGTHVQCCREALAHGKHVICEKPIALSKADAIELFAYAKEKQCFLMEAQKSVFLPVTLDLKTIIDTQSLGKLHQIEFTYSFPSPESEWMHDPIQGGVLYASGNYIIEYLAFLLAPKSWQMSAICTREETGAIDCVNMSFLVDKIMVNGRITIRGNTHKHAIFYFENGYIMIPVFWKSRKAYVYNNQDECIQTIEHPVDHEMVYEVQHIHECIEEGLLESPIMNSNMSILCCHIIDILQSSLQTIETKV